MRSSILQRNGAAPLIVLAAMGTALACSPGEKAGDTSTAAAPPVAASSKPCHTPADSILGLATLRFTKHISPKPHRFLIPVRTDSALPDRVHWALQTSAATVNIYPPDTALQRKARAQLGANGSYTMLLLNYHGQNTLPDGRIAHDFSGHYMGGDVEGKAIPRTRIIFSCHAEGERFTVETQVAPAS
jgi:hypothetical protein